MAIYKVIKKQIFITSRIIKADSEGDALDKFREVSADIDPVLEDPHFEEEIDVEERNDYNPLYESLCDSLPAWDQAR